MKDKLFIGLVVLIAVVSTFVDFASRVASVVTDGLFMLLLVGIVLLWVRWKAPKSTNPNG